MNLILDASECKDYVLGYFLASVKQVVGLLQIVAPIVLIVALVISLSKLVITPDSQEKKGTRGIYLEVMGILFFFLLPWLVELTLNVFVVKDKDGGALYVLGSCFKYADEIKKTLESTPNQSVGNGIPPTNITSNSYLNSVGSATPSSGKGLGKVLNVSIQYNVKDSAGRCGKGSRDYCASVATVEYQNKTVKYYVGYQNNSQLLSGSCRAHALTGVINAVKGTNISTLDLQNYMYKLTPNSGVLVGKKLDQAIQHYGLNATIYHSELSRSDAATKMREAVKNGQPVMIFVAHSLCSDLAGTHHAYIVLDIDSNDNVVMIDSCNYPRTSSYKKRTPEQLAQCLSPDSISNSYYRMIVFDF